jgi:hypothetical protein
MIDHKIRHQSIRQVLKPVLCIPKLTDLLLTQAPLPPCAALPGSQQLKVQLPDLDDSRKGLLPLKLLPLLCQ